MMPTQQTSSIPLSVPNLSGRELACVTDAIEQQWISTGGSYITQFENALSQYAHIPSVLAVQSGTAALHLAMIECGVKSGELVIAPTLTFIAAINPIRYVGASPVFMDCDDSLCMDTDKLDSYFSECCELQNNELFDKSLKRKIAAILVVHVFGNMADMESIMDIAMRYNLPVIEDATEAIGTFYASGRYKGKMAGNIGEFGAYSFNGNKIITTGGGGALFCREANKVAHARYLSTQAKDNEVYFIHHEMGYNYRMTNLQAALGVAQMDQLEGFVETKKTNYQHYNEHGIPLLPFRFNTRPNYWFYSFCSRNRDGLIQYLGEKGIQSRPVWKLIHTLRMYKNCLAFDIKKAEEYCAKIVNIPCSTNLTKDEADFVIESILQYEGRK